MRLGKQQQTVVKEGRSDRSTFCLSAFESGCRGSEVPKVARPSLRSRLALSQTFTSRRTAHPPNSTAAEGLAEGSGDCAEMAIVMTDLTASDSLGSSGGNVVIC